MINNARQYVNHVGSIFLDVFNCMFDNTPIKVKTNYIVDNYLDEDRIDLNNLI